MTFDAFWIPDPETWDVYYPPELGMAWLRQQPGPRALLVPTQNNAQFAGSLHGIELLTRRSWSTGDAASVLVCFPNAELLEIANGYQLQRVCVADNGNLAVSAWVERHHARALIPANYDGVPPDRKLPDPPRDIREELEHIIAFDAHNSFIGAGGKEASIKALRRINQRHPELEPQMLEAWAYAHPDVTAQGAARLRTWLEEIRDGVRHRDSGRRPI